MGAGGLPGAPLLPTPVLPAHRRPPAPGPHPRFADIFASSLLLAATIMIDHWPQLMADIRAGRCFSWLDGEAAATTNGTSAANGAAANGAAAGGSPTIPPPPAFVAAAVDATLAPSPTLADELQKVRAVRCGGASTLASPRSQAPALPCAEPHSRLTSPCNFGVQVFDGGRAGLLERLFPNLQHVNAVMTGALLHAQRTLPAAAAPGGCEPGGFLLPVPVCARTRPTRRGHNGTRMLTHEPSLPPSFLAQGP